MGGSSSGIETAIKRYAPYIESKHKSFLESVGSNRAAALANNPFSNYTDVDAKFAFFGIGAVLTTPLYDVVNQYVLSLDIDVLWNKIFSRGMSRPEVENSVASTIKEIDDKFDLEIYPEFMVGMRNVNAVCSSSFVVGKAVIADTRIKQTAAIRLSTREELLPEILSEFAASLNHNMDVAKRLAAILKEYFLWKIDTDNANTIAAANSALWPFTVLSFEGAALAAMQGTRAWQKTMAARERSMVSKALLATSYAVTGGYIGSAIGGPLGTVIGAVVGFVVGFAAILFE